MSAPQTPALQAVASQLAAALDEYERDTAAMLESWPDLERYRKVSAQIETIRSYSSGVPEARVQWVELLIAHGELVHSLWRVQYGDQAVASTDVLPVREHHSSCVAALRQRCQRLARRAAHGPGAP